jgi:hypothetical protein
MDLLHNFNTNSNNNNKINNINNKLLLNSKIKLEEMITLNLIKGSGNSGAVKKMLHVPTLKTYIIKEEPIVNKEVRKNLMEWISFWQNKLYDSESHVKIYGSFWNQPEGCVSILME